MKTDASSERVFLNPLGVLEEGSSSDDALRFLCSHEIVVLGGADVDSIIERDRETRPIAGSLGDKLTVCRLDQKDLAEILWPLRAAGSAFCTGHYLATITMAGVAVEQLFVRERPDTRAEKWPFGKRLNESGWDQSDSGKGEKLRVLRNDAVHRAQGGKAEALEAFRLASLLVGARLGWRGPDSETGTIVLPPDRP